MNKLRKFADWQSGSDDYMESGELPPFDMPDIIKNPLNKK